MVSRAPWREAAYSESDDQAMKLPWKRIGTGLKIALGVAIKLNDAHVINVKELDKVKSIRDAIASEVAANKPSQPPVL